MKNKEMKRPASKPARHGDRALSVREKKEFKGRVGEKAEKSRTVVEEIDIAKIVLPSNDKCNAKSGCDKVLPELLAPAGSMASLRAAVAAGADAVYFGGGDFNARINAQNFGSEELREAISLLHEHGRRAYITLNTLVHSREMENYLRFAEEVYLAGADALIVADMGGAQAIHRHLPGLELHASTQMSGHNLAEAELLSHCGFSRMVCARELTRQDMDMLVKNSPIEIEAFVHGALCVCHSGQCLFSSLVGGRSGNRGQCAQPCRLPYTVNGKEEYPLSLKDLSLAQHITELIDIGVQSLKIEGRMKSPEYVFGVTRAFRTLLDEHRDASSDELTRLSHIFSRDGFTDGYFESRINSSMLGRRSEEQKRFSRVSLTSSEKIDEIKKNKLKICADASVRIGEPSSLTLRWGDVCVTATGAIPERAINAPMSYDSVKASLSKFGATDFELESMSLALDDGVMIPVSALNALRRNACDMLSDALSVHMCDNADKRDKVGFEKYEPISARSERQNKRCARFYAAEQITDGAREYFDVIYLPLDKYRGECEGIVMPPVILDGEREKVEEMLAQARNNGAKYALVGNLGALELADKYGYEIHGDFRFNVYNTESVAFLEGLGVTNIMLSPELTLTQIRDIKGDVSVAVYGRIPLMLLEKCVAREVSDCSACHSGEVVLTDRRGVDFPVLREYEHRNTVYNSAPTYMADREDELMRAKINNRHFIFSDESADEVDKIISAYKSHISAPVGKMIRRIQ